MTEKILDAAKALFLHEAADYDADPETAEAAWLLDEELRDFWVERATIAATALGLVA